MKSKFMKIISFTSSGLMWWGWPAGAARPLDSHFGAPVINSTTDVASPSYGDIVLDNSGTFWGYTYNSSSGQWATFNAPNTAPTVTNMTSASCASGYTAPSGAVLFE